MKKRIVFLVMVLLSGNVMSQNAAQETGKKKFSITGGILLRYL